MIEPLGSRRSVAFRLLALALYEALVGVREGDGLEVGAVVVIEFAAILVSLSRTVVEKPSRVTADTCVEMWQNFIPRLTGQKICGDVALPDYTLPPPLLQRNDTPRKI